MAKTAGQPTAAQWQLIELEDYTLTVRDGRSGAMLSVTREGGTGECQWVLHHFDGSVVARETGSTNTLDEAIEAAAQVLAQFPQRGSGASSEDVATALPALRSRDGKMLVFLGPRCALFVEEDHETGTWELCLHGAGQVFWRLGGYASEQEATEALAAVERWMEQGARGVFRLDRAARGG